MAGDIDACLERERRRGGRKETNQAKMLAGLDRVGWVWILHIYLFSYFEGSQAIEGHLLNKWAWFSGLQNMNIANYDSFKAYILSSFILCEGKTCCWLLKIID